MNRRRTARSTVLDLMILVGLIGAYLAPQDLTTQTPLTGTLIGLGCLWRGILVAYRTLSRWMLLVMASGLIDPLWQVARPFERVSWLADRDPIGVTGAIVGMLISQGVTVVAYWLVFRDVAGRLAALPGPPIGIAPNHSASGEDSRAQG